MRQPHPPKKMAAIAKNRRFAKIHLKMVFFVCFRAITFIPVDLFPWNFNIMILATK
jgi:hypothetical protein